MEITKSDWCERLLGHRVLKNKWLGKANKKYDSICVHWYIQDYGQAFKKTSTSIWKYVNKAR